MIKTYPMETSSGNKECCCIRRKGEINERTVELLKQGDISAFDTVYSNYCGKLQGFIYKILKSEDDTRGVTQEVFISFWVNREKIIHHSFIRSLLFTIAYHRAIDRLRKKNNERKYHDYIRSHQAEPKNKTEDDYHFNELEKQLNTVINKLPFRRRQVFRLSRDYHFSNREIAEHMDISVNTVENHMTLALDFLKKNLPLFS